MLKARTSSTGRALYINQIDDDYPPAVALIIQLCLQRILPLTGTFTDRDLWVQSILDAEPVRAVHWRWENWYLKSPSVEASSTVQIQVQPCLASDLRISLFRVKRYSRVMQEILKADGCAWRGLYYYSIVHYEFGCFIQSFNWDSFTGIHRPAVDYPCTIGVKTYTILVWENMRPVIESFSIHV